MHDLNPKGTPIRTRFAFGGVKWSFGVLIGRGQIDILGNFSRDHSSILLCLDWYLCNSSIALYVECTWGRPTHFLQEVILFLENFLICSYF